MTTSRTALRLLALLFLLAGILLLQKPVFGQTNLTAPQIRTTTPGEDSAGQYNRVHTRVPDYLLHIESTFEAIENPLVCVESLQLQTR